MAELVPKNAVAWVAYHSDWSGFVLFREEIDALRYAVREQMNVVLVLDGQDPREATRSRITQGASDPNPLICGRCGGTDVGMDGYCHACHQHSGRTRRGEEAPRG